MCFNNVGFKCADVTQLSYFSAKICEICWSGSRCLISGQPIMKETDKQRPSHCDHPVLYSQVVYLQPLFNVVVFLFS